MSNASMELITKYKQGKLTTADIKILNNTIVCLMVLIAVSSILCSISIHILSSDFGYGILGAKLVFAQRDFGKLNERSKRILYQDLGNLINETYMNAALEEDTSESNAMSEVEDNPTTKKPKTRKITHLFQISSNLNVPDADDDVGDDYDEVNTTTALPKVKFDIEGDRRYLATTVVNPQTFLQQSASVQFIYSFPILSEMVAIIWTAMCLIYQSTVKKYCGLPKPWRIVIPSILIFTLMSLGSLVYTVLAYGYLKSLCNGLRENLSNPTAISCGQAISVLRPVIREHEFRHDVYLNLFRISFILSMVLWLLALLVMVLRYIFAIDFQLAEIIFDSRESLEKHTEPEFVEVLLSSQKCEQQPKLLQVKERHKSEDDFQSAKSYLSEVAAPLLEQTQQQNIRIV